MQSNSPQEGNGGGRGEEGGGQQRLWPLHPCCRPVTPPAPAFVNSTSMCGLELKQEAFSKAVFCWLRVRLSVCRVGHIHLFSHKICKNGTDACGAIDATGEHLPLSKETKPNRAASPVCVWFSA